MQQGRLVYTHAMPTPKNAKKPVRVFISHASADLAAAQEVQAALKGPFESWLDRSDIHLGVLLGKELQQSIAASELVVLIWSNRLRLRDG